MMPTPIIMLTVLTRARVVEELQAIEDELREHSETALVRIRDLRHAIERKPIQEPAP